ncbi:hypothetical protein RAC89_22270 [Paenibacillus sp. GD4]|uniref:hypothetical protein n=1 Tax=Paenibacillus sp. GD4 TaxID=3068890 RepID=UPI0027964CD9|nr:hypothetical protein [Paenibacillus sp. GD4]MDQ1913124.1 hypothetical protein [Paenibacillus sp. GD4]
MYNQGFQQNSFQNQFGTAGSVTSQYRGLQTQYQPIGYVQSQYGQSTTPSSFSNQFAAGAQQFGMGTQQYHTANYRGNQQGHDQYLRADATQPSQAQFGMGASNFGTQNISGSFSSQFPTSISQNQNQNQNQGFYQQTSPQSYHTANYRGNQQGHDQYLRADATQPSQAQFGMGASSFNNQFSSSIPTQQQFGQSSFGRF